MMSDAQVENICAMIFGVAMMYFMYKTWRD